MGGRLLAGEPVVRIFKDEYTVAAEILAIKSMSAHGDYEDLLHFLSCQDPKDVKRIFLVHGEYEVQQQFAERIRDVGFKNVSIPEYHEEFEL